MEEFAKTLIREGFVSRGVAGSVFDIKLLDGLWLCVWIHDTRMTVTLFGVGLVEEISLPNLWSNQVTHVDIAKVLQLKNLLHVDTEKAY